MSTPPTSVPASSGEAVLHTASGAHALQLRVAANFFTRFAGLMLRAPLTPEQGLLLTRCPSVHTAFMRYPIDVIYLDDGGRVLKCVAILKPWRGSLSHAGRDEQGKPHRRAAHTLELTAGSIARLDIRPGDRLRYALWSRVDAACDEHSHARGALRRASRQRGAAMLEFAMVGPVVTLLGLAVLQYGMLFFAKNQINHASFMAARAGSMGNANLTTVRQAYERALIPLYGGGRNDDELVESLRKVQDDLAGNLQIELLNPTRESFDDWSDPALKRKYGTRAIPNGGLAYKDPADIKASSGQNIQDANLLKLRITQGYEPKVPLAGLIYNKYLTWLDAGSDAFHTQLVKAGRIPVVSHVTLRMQSDAVEPASLVSAPGKGNNGNPTDLGDLPVTDKPPPECATIGCTVEPKTPVDPGGGGDAGESGCTDGSCPWCPLPGAF